MGKIYSEEDVTWSSIERYYDYSKAVWSVGKDGIPRYVLLDENHDRINVGFEIVK
jgi:hypothetical protein